MCIYGYCRISTPKQSIERQVRNISSQFPEAIIIREAYTGTTFDRPLWNRLQKQVKAGDTIVLDSVSRMSRNSEEGFSDYKELYLKGVNLVFLNEYIKVTSEKRLKKIPSSKSLNKNLFLSFTNT